MRPWPARNAAGDNGPNSRVRRRPCWLRAESRPVRIQQLQSARVHLREARARHTPEMTKLMLSFCKDVDGQSGRKLADYIPDLHQACTRYLEQVSLVAH